MPAITSYLTGITEQRKYKLVEISGITADPDQTTRRPLYDKAYLCPAHLGHVKVFPEFVRLFTIDEAYIEITLAEWDRIKVRFGYQSSAELKFADLIFPHGSLEEEEQEE